MKTSTDVLRAMFPTVRPSHKPIPVGEALAILHDVQFVVLRGGIVAQAVEKAITELSTRPLSELCHL